MTVVCWRSLWLKSIASQTKTNTKQGPRLRKEDCRDAGNSRSIERNFLKHTQQCQIVRIAVAFVTRLGITASVAAMRIWTVIAVAFAWTSPKNRKGKENGRIKRRKKSSMKS
ncbi:uncharacterized protein LOC122255536 [Penaeus japonicus]|uniref:uncharacterized protein LOC122255536 n=1 Tax=Penaeus japonicus TaxID=27405 RepID=UPI001C70DB77|nr:uncharacterized protein LOC122255536 [Penaeus japonicus]